MTLLAEPAGRLLEHTGNCVPRGMTVQDRTRLTGQLPTFPATPIALSLKQDRGLRQTSLYPSCTAACFYQPAAESHALADRTKNRLNQSNLAILCQ